MLKWTFVMLLLLLSMISFSFEKYELTLLDPKTNVFETKTFDFNKSEIIFEKLKYKVTLDKNKYHNYDTALVTLENLSSEKDRALVAKVISWTKMPASAPAIMTAFQLVKRRKGKKGMPPPFRISNNENSNKNSKHLCIIYHVPNTVPSAFIFHTTL